MAPVRYSLIMHLEVRVVFPIPLVAILAWLYEALESALRQALRYTIRGNVIGDLPGDCAKTSVMFRREFGAIDDVGGSGGVPVQADGSFEDKKHLGIYTAELAEFSAPNEDGRVHLVRRLGEVKFDLTQGDLDDVKIYVSAGGEK